jgi:hypothetical protein
LTVLLIVELASFFSAREGVVTRCPWHHRLVILCKASHACDGSTGSRDNSWL